MAPPFLVMSCPALRQGFALGNGGYNTVVTGVGQEVDVSVKPPDERVSARNVYRLYGTLIGLAERAELVTNYLQGGSKSFHTLSRSVCVKPCQRSAAKMQAQKSQPEGWLDFDAYSARGGLPRLLPGRLGAEPAGLRLPMSLGRSATVLRPLRAESSRG